MWFFFYRIIPSTEDNNVLTFVVDSKMNSHKILILCVIYLVIYTYTTELRAENPSGYNVSLLVGSEDVYYRAKQEGKTIEC